MSFELVCNSSDIESFYQSQVNMTSSSIKLYTTRDIEFHPGESININLNIKGQLINDTHSVPYCIYPSDNISQTPLQFSNSIYIIDKEYRDTIKISLRYIPTYSILKSISSRTHRITTTGCNQVCCNSDLSAYKYILQKGTCIAQIREPTLKPIYCKFVNSFSNEIH